MKHDDIKQSLALIQRAVAQIEESLGPTVHDVLHDSPLEPLLEQDIRDCPAASVVGAAVVKLADNLAALLATSAEEGGALEADVRTDLLDACVRQCNVWYF